MFKNFLLISFFLFFTACAQFNELPPSVSSQAVVTPPVLVSVEPLTLVPGDTAILHGLGFSPVAHENIVVIGGQSIPALTYQMGGEAGLAQESLAFVVPEGLEKGERKLELLVGEELSNALTVTVGP